MRLRVNNADRFDPDFWLGRDAADAAPFVPFSAGPAACPGRQLVTLVGAAWFAALLDACRCKLINPALLEPVRPLPGDIGSLLDPAAVFMALVRTT
jgi:cytochrome P450